MIRLALVTGAVVALLAPNAFASTTINQQNEYTFPPVFGSSDRLIRVVGSNGANHDIVVKPSGAQQLGGYPQRVDVYDYGDSFDAANSNCKVFSAHHAACIVSGGPQDPANPYSYEDYAEIAVATGDGNDVVTISDPLNPMVAEVGTGDGNDHVEIAGMWQLLGPYFAQDSLGPGNDYEKVGAPPAFMRPGSGSLPLIDGREVWAGSGDDTLDTLNGASDHIHCEDGTDTWTADATDDQNTDGYNKPPNTNGDCETRTPPAP